jgi:hypothetical protein
MGEDHLGTVRNRWMNIIKMDFKNIGCRHGDQIHLSQGQDQLWTLMNTAIIKFFKWHKISPHRVTADY